MTDEVPTLVLQEPSKDGRDWGAARIRFYKVMDFQAESPLSPPSSIALRILEVAAELKLMSGRGPPSMAAAATYIACLLTGERRTQEQIAQVGSISSVTLRNRFKELSRMIQISLNV